MKTIFKNYIVQVDGKKGVKVVYHTFTKSSTGLYYKFSDVKKARALLKLNKTENPNLKYRIIVISEAIDYGNWI